MRSEYNKLNFMIRIRFSAAILILLMFSACSPSQNSGSSGLPSEDVTHTVTFMLSELDLYTSQNVANGGYAVRPVPDPEPVTDLYIFNGWYMDEVGIYPYDFNTPVTSDITLYAGWKYSDTAEEPYSIFNIIQKEDSIVIKSIRLEAIEAGLETTDIVIPDEIYGKPVTEIAETAFINNEWMTSIVLPDTLKTIGPYAFSSCTALQHVAIPASLTDYDQGFQDSGLVSVVIEDGASAIPNSAFANCHNLVTVEIPDSVESIGDSAFYECESLSDIALPDRLKTIGDSAFSYTGLCNLEFPSGLVSIGSYAFDSTKISSVIIPDGVKELGDSAFTRTPAESVSLPRSIEIFGVYAFPSSVKEIILRDGISSIDKAFGNAFESSSDVALYI